MLPAPKGGGSSAPTEAGGNRRARSTEVRLLSSHFQVRDFSLPLAIFSACIQTASFSCFCQNSMQFIPLEGMSRHSFFTSLLLETCPAAEAVIYRTFRPNHCVGVWVGHVARASVSLSPPRCFVSEARAAALGARACGRGASRSRWLQGTSRSPPPALPGWSPQVHALTRPARPDSLLPLGLPASPCSHCQSSSREAGCSLSEQSRRIPLDRAADSVSDKIKCRLPRSANHSGLLSRGPAVVPKTFTLAAPLQPLPRAQAPPPPRVPRTFPPAKLLVTLQNPLQ